MPLLLHAEEYSDASLYWEECFRLRFEVGDGLSLNHILLIVQGKGNLGDMLEILDFGIGWEESIHNKKMKFVS